MHVWINSLCVLWHVYYLHDSHSLQSRDEGFIKSEVYVNGRYQMRCDAPNMSLTGLGCILRKVQTQVPHERLGTCSGSSPLIQGLDKILPVGGDRDLGRSAHTYITTTNHPELSVTRTSIGFAMRQVLRAHSKSTNSYIVLMDGPEPWH